MPKSAAIIVPESSEDQASTQSSSVYDRLYADILTGALSPGLKLRLKELIERYQTGNSPLREALNRLSAIGMVIREENRGFRVPYASRENLMELTRTRCWLEDTALRESIANGDSSWEEKVVLAFHWLERTPRHNEENPKTSSPAWEKYHHDFHLSLISACGSDILVEFCSDLANRSIRYQNLAEVVEYRDRHELDEHRDLKDAALNRDADKAAGLLRQHYEITNKILIESGRFD